MIVLYVRRRSVLGLLTSSPNLRKCDRAIFLQDAESIYFLNERCLKKLNKFKNQTVKEVIKGASSEHHWTLVLE